jgi:hypothetical protein
MARRTDERDQNRAFKAEKSATFPNALGVQLDAGGQLL